MWDCRDCRIMFPSTFCSLYWWNFPRHLGRVPQFWKYIMEPFYQTGIIITDRRFSKISSITSNNWRFCQTRIPISDEDKLLINISANSSNTVYSWQYQCQNWWTLHLGDTSFSSSPPAPRSSEIWKRERQIVNMFSICDGGTFSPEENTNWERYSL